jgi:hypothetical protein
MPRLLPWRRRDTADAPYIWQFAMQAQIRPVLSGAGHQRYERFDVCVPYWPFTMRRHLRLDHVKFAFTHSIDERIRKEIVEPSGMSQEILVLWCKKAEERYTVPRRLIGRCGIRIFEWHIVSHA